MPVHGPVQSDAGERQITHDSAYDHLLDNNDNFSPDDRFLVFDTRTPVGHPRVGPDCESGNRHRKNHAPVPARARQPRSDRAWRRPALPITHNEVIFIHGPLHPTSPDNQYEKHCRLGGMCPRRRQRSMARSPDARNVNPPFTVGALRGGHASARVFGGRPMGRLHVQRCRGAGSWPRDRQEPRPADDWRDETRPSSPRRPRRANSPNEGPDSRHWSSSSHPIQDRAATRFHTPPAIAGSASRVTDAPTGRRQRARAFIGTTRQPRSGQPLDELFIVDIPEEITAPGPLGPLQGTETSSPCRRPAPCQRRLTHTEASRFPVARESPAARLTAQRIAFRLRDDKGRSQIFLISPQGRPATASHVRPRWRRYGGPLAFLG